MDTIDTIRRLWRRESVELVDGAGETVSLTMFPPPVQPSCRYG